MKKLFFFKSSTSNNVAPSQTKEKSFGDGIQDTRTSRSKKAAFEDQNQIQNSPHLRRSRSFSSGTFHDSGMLRTQSDSACSSSSNISHKQSAPRSSRRALTPERHSRTKWFEENTNGVDNVSLESSSYCSTNASNKILDRYIDGEQHHQEKTNKHSNPNSNTKTHQNNGGKRPPRFQYAAPASPTTEGGGGGLTQKPRSHSFRDPNRESKLYMSTRDWVENGVVVHNHGSPRKLAKQVIERLSQSRVLPRVDSKEFDHDHHHHEHDHEHEHGHGHGHGHDIPITLEDIYGGSHSHPDDTVLDYDESEETDDVAFLKAELHSRTRKLEKEKNELQAALEKELDRRSTEWSMKLEKYQMEEHRLRERVRELAEQNVSLQREVSMYGEKELDSQSRVMHSGQQVKDLTFRMEEVIEENQNLHRDLSELQDRYRGAEEDRDCLKRNYNEKDKECKELHKAVTRLLRTCNEQEKTIDGLREGVSKEMREKGCSLDHDVRSKLQSEQLRLTGVEQGLRKEVESYRVEVESLRHENINLLHRLKGSSKDNNVSTFKLDQELWSRVHCLQNQGMCLIKESVVLCSKLLENIKERACHSSLERNEALQNGLDSQLVMESDMKLQGFKRGAETLTRSLQNVADVLRDKSSCTVTPDIESSEEVVQSDLKAEALLTSLLREKLYAKEVDVERLEAELATAVRGNDVLKCEVQNAMDTLSCITHKMKELEMQVMKKEEGIYRLQNNLQDCKKELSIVNGILPKVTEERNMMWEEVQKYSENNMLLSSEIGMLKKKVEALDEDVLLKEGQITILKDAIGKPFDLLSSSPVTTGGFLL